MRHLNLKELQDFITKYSSDITYCDYNHLDIKLNQFMSFLYEQPISIRTLERINIEFKNIKDKHLEVIKKFYEYKETESLLESLKTNEKQGAFGYFEIDFKFKSYEKNSLHYLDNIDNWYTTNSIKYIDYQKYFNTYFFSPFIDLLQWYLRESEIKSERDYFSFEEIEKYEKHFIDIQTKIAESNIKIMCGQEVIFNELEEIRFLLNGLNKKNWTEIIEGKFQNLIVTKMLSSNEAKKIIKLIDENILANFLP